MPVLFLLQGGNEDHGAVILIWGDGPPSAPPSVHCALLGPGSRHHKQRPRSLDHQFLPHRDGPILFTKEESSNSTQPGSPQRFSRYGAGVC